jgi:hypothetical protein
MRLCLPQFAATEKVKVKVLRTRQKPKGTSSLPHPAESGDRSRTVRVAGSDLIDYANPPRLCCNRKKGIQITFSSPDKMAFTV